MYERLKILRRKNKFNQSQIAQMLSISQTGYSKYETGENDIPTNVLIKLANIYNVSVDFILGISDIPDRKS